MKRLSLLQLIPGMVVAQNVQASNGEMLIPHGTILNSWMITRLELYGILTIYVEDTVPRETFTPPVPETPSYYERVRKSEEFKEFNNDYELELSDFRSTINNVVERNMKLDIDLLLKHSLAITSLGEKKGSIFAMMQNMREYDDSTYAHCINVALLSNILATWLKFSPEEVNLATSCGLLHDIGKLLVPHDILSKPARLTPDEYEEIQKHPVAGYQLLKKQGADVHIQNAALMHHERSDGSGYPLRLHGNQIDRFARLVSIVDVYDAMTAARVYRGPVCPFRVIELYESEGFQKYDVEYLMTFLENVVNTYIRNRCRLSDGREGDIIYINRYKLSRPIVQCGTEYVNLSEYPDLTIEVLL